MRRYLATLINGARRGARRPRPRTSCSRTAAYDRAGGARAARPDAALRAGRRRLGGEAVSAPLGRPNLISIDMGGTSFDVEPGRRRRPTSRPKARLDGLPVRMPMVDIHTIGAGGGSLAWIERGRACASGRRAPAPMPGPACYGRGGTERDGHRRQPRARPDRSRRLRRRRDDARPRRRPSGRRTHRRAARLSTPRRWRRASSTSSTPRWRTRSAPSPSSRASTRATSRWSPSAAPGRCTPSALAEELEIGEVIVPVHPGAFSAWGMLQTDVSTN